MDEGRAKSGALAKGQHPLATEIPASGVVVHDPQKCVGCGACMMVCGAYHGGEVGPSKARLTLDMQVLTGDGVVFHVCRHCASPSCYFACPQRDDALCIEQATGARYINEDRCSGCRDCIAACPFDPPGIKFDPVKLTAFKCDLCTGRKSGPACVEFCPAGALTFVTREKR